MKRFSSSVRASLAALLLLAAAVPCLAQPTLHTFTDRDAFLAAVPGPLTTTDFESLTGGSTVPNGSVFDEVTIAHSIGGHTMLIADVFAQATPAGANSLGLDVADSAYLSGDSFAFTFDTPQIAFAITIIGSPGDTQANDFTLHLESTDIPNTSATQAILSDGGETYFLGAFLEDAPAGSGFQTASLMSSDPGQDGLFLFTLDDIQYRPPLNDAPTNLLLSNAQVPENSPLGTTIGTLSTEDPDVGDSHTYSLVSGLGSDDNAAFTIVGDTLRTAQIFDYETQLLYSIRVRTDDGEGGTLERPFSISVTDVAETVTVPAFILSHAPSTNRPAGALATRLLAAQ